MNILHHEKGEILAVEYRGKEYRVGDLTPQHGTIKQLFAASNYIWYRTEQGEFQLHHIQQTEQ